MQFDAIVIGGSHGSFDVLMNLFASLPRSDMPPIFVVIHIPRDSTQDFVTHFNTRCGCRMVEIEDKQVPVGDRVYLAPGGYHALLERDRRLSLSSDEPVNHAQPSIDVLFESAAVAYGNRLLAVLLTGASSDGAAGMARIDALGGTTIVQDPTTARSPVMPKAALALIRPDHLVAPDVLADTIRDLVSGAQPRGMMHGDG